jgi:hypothetical protein
MAGLIPTMTMGRQVVDARLRGHDGFEVMGMIFCDR